MKRSGNFSFNPNPECKDGDVFDDFNLTQLVPNTQICAGVKGLIFQNGNIVNCTLPKDAINKCYSIQISFCSHLHPEWVDKGLPVCTTDCIHQKDKYEFDKDGKTEFTSYEYEDKI